MWNSRCWCECPHCFDLLLHRAKDNSLFWQCSVAPLLTWLQALSSNKLQIGNQAESLSMLRLSACKTMQLWRNEGQWGGEDGEGMTEWEGKRKKKEREGGRSRKRKSVKAEYWLVMCVCVRERGGGGRAGEALCRWMLSLVGSLSLSFYLQKWCSCKQRKERIN